MGKDLIKCAIFAFICVLTCGCASRRIISHTQQENAVETKFDASNETTIFDDVIKSAIVAVSDTSRTEQTIDVVIYDTHVVSSSGEHPVKVTAHISTTTKNAIVATGEMNVDSVSLIHNRDTISVSTRDTTSVVINQDRTTKNKTASVFMAFAFLLAVSLAVLITIIIITHKK